MAFALNELWSQREGRKVIKRSRKLLLALLCLPIVLILGVILYLRFADLSGWGGVVEGVVTKAIGRELTISGRFDLEVASVTRVVAEDVAIANPDWSTEPSMVHGDYVAIDLSLWSLLSRPIRIHDVEIRGLEILLAEDAEGRKNWVFTESREPEEPPKARVSQESVGVILENLDLRDLQLVFHGPTREEPLELGVEQLVANLAETGMIDLSLEGDVEGTPVELGGSVGPLEELLVAGRVEHELTGHFGDIEIGLNGTITDLSALTDPDLEIEINGPDVGTVTRTFSLPSLGAGPFRVSGALSPVAPGGPLTLEMSAAVGEVRLAAEGRLSSLLDLGDLDLRLDAEAPDLEALGSVAGIEGLPAGELSISGRLRRDQSRVTFEQFEARAGDNSLAIDGVLSSSPGSTDSEVDFSARGPDLSVFTRLAGIDLPREPYEARGHLVRGEVGGTADGMEVRVGQATLRLDGTVGSLPSFAGSELDFRLESPKPLNLGALAGMGVPSQPVEIEGRIVYGPEEVQVDSVVVRAAGSKARLDGSFDPKPPFVGTDLEVRAAGIDLARVASLIPVELPELVELPADPYEIGGRFRVLSDGYALEGIEASIGENVLEVDGRLGPLPDLVGTELSVKVSGPELAWAGSIAGVGNLPTEPWEATTRLRVVGDGYALDEFEASVGENVLDVAGRLGPLPDLAGTELNIEVGGPELSWLGSVAGVAGLPAQPYGVAGRLRVAGEGYELDELIARAGAITVEASGHLGPFPDLDGSAMALRIGGARLSDLGAYDELPPLPADPFNLTGRIGIQDDIYTLEEVVATAGDNRLTVFGTLTGLPRLGGTDLSLALGGPDASTVGQAVAQAGVDWLEGLPPGPYYVSARLQVDDSGYRLRDLALTLGGIELQADGRMASLSEFVGTEVTVDASGPDASVIGGIVGIEAPAERFEIDGRVEFSDTGTHYHGVRAELGDYRVEIDGSLGKLPKLSGTQLDIHAEGPDTALLAEFLEDGAWLPGQPFAVSGHFEGNPERFHVEELRARLGSSDLSGSLQIDLLGGTPDMQGDLRSEHLNVSELLGMEEAPSTARDGEDEVVAVAVTEAVPDENGVSEPEFLISAAPLELALLEAINIDVRHTLGVLTIPAGTFTNVVVGARLKDGRLRIERSSVEGSISGSFAISLTLEPKDSGYRLFTTVEGNELKFPGFTPDRNLRHAVPIAFALELDGSGDSPHAIASSIDGYLIAVFGKGRIDRSPFQAAAAKLPGGGFFAQLFDTLNPTWELTPYTALECGVAVANIDNGVVDIDPLVARIPELSVLGRGSVDLESEELDFDWVTRPRKLALSVVTLTDSFIKLGGTLTAPKVQAKRLEAVTATSVGVATAGVSVVAEGLWERMRTGWRICRKAGNKARQELETRKLQSRRE